MKKVLLTAACLAALSSGCADTAATEAAKPSKPTTLDVSVLRFADTVALHEPPPSEAVKAAWSDVVIRGTVAGFSQGRVINTPGGRPLHRMVMVIDVTEKIKGPDAYLAGDKAYLEVWGGHSNEPDKFNNAIPAGTRVIAFASDKLMEGGGDVSVGHPAGTRLLSANNPQSLIFEIPQGQKSSNGQQIVGGIEDLSQMGPGWDEVNTLDELFAIVKKG